MVNLGNLKADAGQFENSRAYYLEAIDILTLQNQARALGIVYSNLALQELKLNRPVEAIPHFQSALEYHRAIGDEDSLATTYGQLGKAFFLIGQSAKAEACLNNASEHFIKLGNEPGEAGALRVLAEVYRKQGDPISELRCLERVIQVDLRYQLSQYGEDHSRLQQLRK